MYTLESKIVKGLFLAGELLDIDGITGKDEAIVSYYDYYIVNNLFIYFLGYV